MSVLVLVMICLAIWWGVLFAASLSVSSVDQLVKDYYGRLNSLTSSDWLNRVVVILLVLIFLPLYLHKFPWMIISILLICAALQIFLA